MEVPYEIIGRPKSIYSIYKKIQNKKVSFDEIYDLFAVRIIVDVPPKKSIFVIVINNLCSASVM